MKEEKSILKTEVIYSDDGEYRYLLHKEWDKSKPKAMVIMISPSIADTIVLDYTTMFVVNNLCKLNYGMVDVVNLYPKIGSLSVKDQGEEVETENIKTILKCADKVDKIIIAWGKIGNTNKKVKEKQDKYLSQLEGYKDKLLQINEGLHPLSPEVRSEWKLKEFKK